MPPRKTNPNYLTRAEVEALIAEAVAAERGQSEQALAGVMLALGGAAQAFDLMGDALDDIAVQLDRHEAVVSVMEAALATSEDGAGETHQDEVVPS